VEASADGINWSQVGQFTGRDNTWVESFHSLSTFSGPGNENIRIRFRLVTDDSGTDSGVRIDDVKLLQGMPPTSADRTPNAEKEIPSGFSLSQNYPNPFDLSQNSRFRPETIIEYAIRVPGKVTMEIYNILGQRVRIFVRENLEAGIHKMQWDGKDNLGRNLTSGVYIYRIESGNFAQSRKLVLLR